MPNTKCFCESHVILRVNFLRNVNVTFALFLVLDENKEDTITRINSKLPPCIRVQSIKKVTKNFNSKSAADSRTYLYFLPTFAFASIVPNEDTNEECCKVTYDFRMTPELRQEVNRVLKEFIGTRYYHNYTSGK